MQKAMEKDPKPIKTEIKPILRRLKTKIEQK
jgi:hypothetical protein